MIARMALDFLPDRPFAERVARHVLAQLQPTHRYDLVDEEEARRGVAEHHAGHVIPEVMALRRNLLTVEVERVGAVLDAVMEVTGLASLAMEEVGGGGGG